MLRLNVKQLVKQQKPPLNKSCCKVIASVSTFCCSKQARRVPPRLCKVEHLPVVHDSRWLNYWKKIRNSKFRRKWKRRWTHAGLRLYKHVTQPNHKSAPANCLQWCVCSSPHTHRSILYQCWIIIIFVCFILFILFCSCSLHTRLILLSPWGHKPTQSACEAQTWAIYCRLAPSSKARPNRRSARVCCDPAVVFLRIDVQMSPCVTESN